MDMFTYVFLLYTKKYLLSIFIARNWGLMQFATASYSISKCTCLLSTESYVILFSSIYEYLEKETFTLEYGVYGIVEKKKEAFETAFRRSVTLGVILCIISVVPIMLAVAVNANEQTYIWCTSILLIFVALGVFLFIWSGEIRSSYDKILQVGDFSPENKEAEKHLSWFPGVYWCITTALYLGISLFFDDWKKSWIIWPVAALLFAAIYAVLKTIANRHTT